jgi:hypothetical protein
MRLVNPLLKAYMIGLAIVLPLTLALNITEASQAVIAPIMTLAFGVCALIGVKLYRDSRTQ